MRSWRGLLGIAVSGAGLWFACRGVAWREVLLSLRGLDRPWVLLLIPLALGGEFVLRSERWRRLLAPMVRAPRGLCFSITSGGLFLNNLLPLRAGELARLAWTIERTRVPLASGLSVLAMDRLLDVGALLALALAGVSLSPIPGLLGRAALFPMGLAAVAWASLLLLARRAEAVHAWLGKRRWPEAVRVHIGRALEGAAALRRGRDLGAVFGLTLTFWCLNAGLLALIGRLFGLPLDFSAGLWLLLGLALGVALPSAPGYVGVFEASGVAVLSRLGVDRGHAVPFLLTFHAAQILSSVLWGAPALGRLGFPRRSAAAGAPPTP